MIQGRSCVASPRPPAFCCSERLRSSRRVIRGGAGHERGAAAPSATAQPPSPGAASVFRVTTEIVQFDATVVDREGKPVTTLGRGDFVVLQDGVPAYPSSGSTSSRWSLLVDDMAMTPDGFKRVKDALRAFVLDGMPPGLEIGILRTGQSGRRTTALTADRDELLTRVEAMQYLARSYHGGPASESGHRSRAHNGSSRPSSWERSAASTPARRLASASRPEVSGAPV